MRPLFDSEYIFGTYEPGGERHMLAAGRPGWVHFAEQIGHDPNDRSGVDFCQFSDQGLGVVCRLSNGPVPDGTIPHSSFHEQFARRVANFVQTSQGCKIWIIGNEMNYAVSRPDVQIDWSRHAGADAQSLDEADPMRRGLRVRFNVLPDNSTEIRTTRGAIISQGELITPELYASCYRRCYDAIHRLPGHADDQVLVGAVAPWNTQTIYYNNPNGDWIQYFREILEILGPRKCDGFTLHTYTHGPDPTLIASEALLPPPFQEYHLDFRAYRDFMNAVPRNMRHLSAYITETDQSGPWADQNSGWVRAAYDEVNDWNQQAGNQQIRALCLYRWPRFDKYYIDGKQGVVDDFCMALEDDYRWQGANAAPPITPPTAVAAQPATVIPAPEPAAPPTIQEVQPAALPDRPESTPANADEPLYSSPEPAIDKSPASEVTSAPVGTAAAGDSAPYAVEWLNDHFPDRVFVGQTVAVHVTVRNIGSLTWNWGGTHPFRMGYHYYRNRRQLPMTHEQEIHTDIPQDVPPGETVDIDVRVRMPEQAGNYTLELDLLHEGVTRFKAQGGKVLTRWVTVETAEAAALLAGDINGANEPASMSDISSNGSRNLPVPLFMDISTTLPHSGVAYAQRPRDQIQYLVISHTAANPMLSLDLIAQAHVRSGYPGIAYNFVVDATGQVYKVSALEDVAQPDADWSSLGVNICLTGNFTAAAPPLPQLDGVGRLCAWLTHNLELTPDAIIGLGELSETTSPGDTFYRGPTWKNMILRQVQLHLAALGNHGYGVRDRELETQLAAIEEKNDTLHTQLKTAQSERERLRLHNERLQEEVQSLHRALEEMPEEVETGLRIQNIIERLPRVADRYVERRVADVQFIVVNHTGVAPDVPLEEIAEVHRQDWPGILYDFVVDARGNILQTQLLERVVETEQAYLSNAVNVAFAGEFDEVVPSDEQLYAGGRLIAWLMGRFPNVTFDHVQGIREFIDHTSPGEQWLSGERWKEMLLASARRASGIFDPSAAEDELRTQVLNLERQMQRLRQENGLLQDTRERLEADLQRSQLELAETARSAPTITIPEPAVREITNELPRHPHLRYDVRPLNAVTHLAVHHTATPPTMSPIRIAELHVNADPARGKEAWPAIGYHYFIHPDGAIDQTNALETASYHVYRHNPHTVGIVFAGSFLNGRIPTSAQLQAGAHLLAWLMQELKVPLARVWGHREFPDNTTICPGSEWTGGERWRDMLFERIEQVQSGLGIKRVRHYMLFWQRVYPGPVARQDFINAINYITRFRPVLGFSVEDAKNAEYVTVVGNDSGISIGEEHSLRQAGCKVERVAGRDEEETGRMLAELARLGRRFRNFDVDF